MSTKVLLSFIASILLTIVLDGQSQYLFEPSAEHPFGLPNPEAPKEILDFAPLIGENHCISTSRGGNQEWTEPVDMTWRFKYILNGHGVQDETLKADGQHSGSIRQFIPDSNKWYVHYYSTLGPTTILPSWEGNKTKEEEIILYRPQIAPNGMEGFYKINFYDITDTTFKWLGEWVTPDESFSYPTWKIECVKGQYNSNDGDKNKILESIESFSQAYMNADYDALAESYTTDAKIFPGNSPIIEGRESIKERWIIKDGSKVLHHKITPNEIKIIGQHAYDYGTYAGKSLLANGAETEWKGKYVIVWKKVNNKWKIYLDIWNRVR